MDTEYNVWINKRVVDIIKPALGTPENVFGGAVPNWLPMTYKSVLDCGCGIGVYHNFLTQFGASYTGVDSSPYMIEEAKALYPESEFHLSNLEKIPFSGNQYGMVWCNAVLIHMPTDIIAKVIAEMRRVSAKWICFNAYVNDSNEDYTPTVTVEGQYIGILNAVSAQKFDTILNDSLGNVRNKELISSDEFKIGDVEARCVRYMITKR